MKLDFRTAALDDVSERRVGHAVSLLEAYGLRAEVSPWDGTRCDLLVTAADDPYGYKALALASRRKTPIIALGEPIQEPGVTVLDAACKLPELARTMRMLLLESGDNDIGSREETQGRPTLCHLAAVPHRGNPVDVEFYGRTLLLRPRTGRVYAATHSDLLAGIESLHEPGCTIKDGDSPGSRASMASASLEALLLRAAYNGKENLPPFPHGQYRLEAWPDLGSSSSLINALRVAKKLLRGPATPDELARTGGSSLDTTEVNAYLWALSAANLLLDADGAKPSVRHASFYQKRMDESLWSRLARRFGLMSRQASE